jgi:hypothetical protein
MAKVQRKVDSPNSASRGILGSSTMMDGLDVVAVGIQNESPIVIFVILGRTSTPEERDPRAATRGNLVRILLRTVAPAFDNVRLATLQLQ